MKEKNKYHIWDWIHIVIFVAILTSFIVASIIGIVKYAKGEVGVNIMIYRLLLTLLMFIPIIIKKILRVTFSRVVLITYYAYMFFAGFLGVILNFNSNVDWWDILIHFLMGLCISVLSIYILNLTVYKKDTSKHNLVFTLIFIVSFALAVGVVWEIGEFLVDGLLNTGFQRYVTYTGSTLVGRNALIDTMVDLIMDFAGSLVGVIFVVIMSSANNKFLKSFKVKKLKKLETEIEDIEE